MVSCKGCLAAPQGQIWVTQPSVMSPQCQQGICIKALISCHTTNLSKPKWGVARGYCYIAVSTRQEVLTASQAPPMLPAAHLCLLWQ